MTKAKTRALLVARISNLTDATTSPESQLQRVRTKAEGEGWQVVGEAVDLDVSATKTTPWTRPELGSWLARPDDFDVIVARGIDRLARNVFDFSDLLRWCKENEIRLVTLEPSIDFSDTIGQMIATVIAYVAQLEAETVRTRVLGARKHMREVGRWASGRAPYGLRLCPHPSGSGYSLEPDPETAPLVREAVDRFLAGESVHSIAVDWTKRGVPTPWARTKRASRTGEAEGKEWTARTLYAVLRSPSLRNVIHHEGRIMRDAEGEPRRYGEPVIDDETWFRIQRTIESRKSERGSNRVGAHPLLGVLLCAVCGERFYSNITGKGVRGYTCRKARNHTPRCPGGTILAGPVDEWVEAEFLRLCGRLPAVEVREEVTVDNGAEIEDTQAALSELEADRYERGLFKGPAGAERFARLYERLETRLAALQAAPTSGGEITEEYTGRTFAEEWENLDTEGRRDLMLRAGFRVTVSPKNGYRDPTARLRVAEGEHEDDWLLGVD